jgi:insecticidal toxin complex protein TccC
MSAIFKDDLPVSITRSFHRDTPSLTAIDPRGLTVRAAHYWRDNGGVVPQSRLNRTVHNAAGRAIAQWDPRLFQDVSAPANVQTIYAFSGTALCTSSVDAGLRVVLLGEAAQAVLGVDGRGSRRWMQYDEQLRPVAMFEQAMESEAICTERLGYGTWDQLHAHHNQCGRLIRHDDPAGTQLFAAFELGGGILEQTRHFLKDLVSPDWPESIADRELLLEPGEGSSTRSQFNAAGEAISQIDAKGHCQLFSQTLGGQLREVRLQLKGAPTPKTLVSAIHYNARGQTKREVAGNGVITTLKYTADDGRLSRLQVQRSSEVLQDLRYEYDPVGNVLSIEDAALPVRFFANQRIEPTSRYYYDTLSQLIEATGWESGSQNKGPQFSTFADTALRANYRQRYRYDSGGNLLELTHEGRQSHGHRLVAASHSNRCLPVLEGVEPGEEDFRQGFDGNGNLLNLQPGQALSWDLRNQLCEVRPVERDSGGNDRESYIYGADGMRLRKVRETQTHARTLIAETRYLPNLELRCHSGTGEVLQVISVQAGRCSVRVLHWESEPPKDIANDQYHYNLTDHLGSSTLELDSDGEVISQERYHPFGTTAWFAGRGEVEASYKTVRYSGKERDATGLYYYGFRYYVAWTQRWLNPDPMGIVDGMNGYVMVGNNPVTYHDWLGLLKVKDLFSSYADLPKVVSMAAELDRYVSLQADVNYSESYRREGDKHTISLSWTELSPHYFPGSEAAGDMSPSADGSPRKYSAGFIKDLQRSTVSISQGDARGSSAGFEASLDVLDTIVEKLKFLEGKIPDLENRARVSEVAFQVSLSDTFMVAMKHSEGENYLFSDASRPSYDIHLNDDESVTVTSSVTYNMKELESTEVIPGLRLAASVETRIGAINGRLTHDALADEKVKGNYTLSFETTATSGSPSPVNKKGFFKHFFNGAGRAFTQTGRQIGS